MTKKELKEAREQLGVEMIRLMDEACALMAEYAAKIGEERPLVLSMTVRPNDDYATATGYISLPYLTEECGLTLDEAHEVPSLFDVTRLKGPEVYHDLLKNQTFLGEEAADETV